MSKPPAVLITGAAQRVGAAIALRLARQGHTIVVHYGRSKDAAEAVAAQIRQAGAIAHPIGANLEHAAERKALIDETFRLCGTLDVLVNSAATFNFDDIDALDLSIFANAMTVNCEAPLDLARHFYARLPADGEGLVINLLDQKVFNLNPDFLSYTISKYALFGATQLLAMAMAPRMRVNGIAPGLTLKSGNQSEESFARVHSKTPLGRGSTPDDIADGVEFLMKCKSVTGDVIMIDGGQHLQKRSRDVMFSYEEGERRPPKA